jgi:signal transduction histidine kinase
VVFAVPDGLDAVVDRKRVLRVLTNLLSNAVRYTPAEAEVTLSAEVQDAWVLLRVADRGPGVAPADLGRLFEPFFRAEGSRSRATGGLGLGLMLVRQIAEAHGGTVKAEARVGGGLSMTVRLPAGLAEGVEQR